MLFLFFRMLLPDLFMTVSPSPPSQSTASIIIFLFTESINRYPMLVRGYVANNWRQTFFRWGGFFHSIFIFRTLNFITTSACCSSLPPLPPFLVLKEVKSGTVSLGINPGEVPGLVPVKRHVPDQRMIIHHLLIETARHRKELWSVEI